MTNAVNDPMANQNGETMPILRLPIGKQLDPLKYRRKYYVLNVQCETKLAGVGRGTVSLDDMPFMWSKTVCGIIDQDSGLAQDLNFLVRVRDSNRYYSSDFARPDLLWGNVFLGTWIPFDVDTFMDANATINVDVINQKARLGADYFTIQFCFHGFERWQR